MRHLDIDIESLRVDILRRQQEAIKPFQEELRNLEILEQMVNRNGVPAGKKAIKPKAAAKPNGHAQPYATMTQAEAVREILRKKPNLMAREVAERMVAYGYPFQTANPMASITTLLRQMEAKGQVTKTEPEKRIGGESNRYALP